MFERFTERANKIVSLATEEASIMGQSYAAPAHIFLAIVIEDRGIGHHVLESMGINLTNARKAASTVLINEKLRFNTKLFSNNAKAVFEQAFLFARELNHNYVGSEHILLGLTRIIDQDLIEIITNLNTTTEKIRLEVMNLIGADKEKIVKIFPQTYLERVLVLATRDHDGQKRSNGSAYINHPISVKNRLVGYCIKNEFVLAAALCHDLREDTNITEEEIKEVAGATVLEAVNQLTNIVPAGTSFEDKTAIMLSHAKDYNDIAKRVKLSDRYDNVAESIWSWEPKKVKRYTEAGLRLIDAMQPLPDDVKLFENEARRLFYCFV